MALQTGTLDGELVGWFDRAGLASERGRSRAERCTAEMGAPSSHAGNAPISPSGGPC